MRWPYVAEFPVVGWDAIWKLLFHAQDKHGDLVPLMSLYSLRQNYRDELLNYGGLFIIHVGPLRKKRYCAWPSRIREWIRSDPVSLPEGKSPEEERAIRTWEAIWRFLFHMNDGGHLVPMLSLGTLREKHGRNLQDCGCLCRFKRHMLAWPSRTRLWIQIAAEKGVL